MRTKANRRLNLRIAISVGTAASMSATRTRRDQAKIGLRDGVRGQRIVRGGSIDDRKPDPLSFEADQRPFYLGRIGDPNDPRKGIAAPLLPF